LTAGILLPIVSSAVTFGRASIVTQNVNQTISLTLQQKWY